MILMQLNNISKSFGVEPILYNIKLEVKTKDRIAIVGRNGSGKSTLLKVMAGEIPYDDGEIYAPKDLTIGYLSQHFQLESDQTIWSEMESVFDHLKAKEQELNRLEEKLKDAAHLEKGVYEQTLKAYDELQQSFQDAGGYQYESEISAVLTGLDFHPDNFETEVRTLSGGQKTRLALGKLLLQKPKLLILDEPTNHLDIDTLTWLENYLTNYPGAIVIVSHDRYFLEKTVSIIYEISRHRTKRYNGSYQKFLDEKKKNYEKDLKLYEQQQEEIKQAEDFIARNIARASTSKRAQSRRKQLENMELIDKPLGDLASASFSFQINKKSGNDVLHAQEVSFKYDSDERSIFKNINLSVNRGDRVALVGPNGVGKTTLLKVLLGYLESTTGKVQLGANVEPAYYDQEQANLSTSKAILDELWDEFPNINETKIRTVLGNFLFSGDDVLKLVQSLSGGEKARLALAKLMLKQANLLILDEPTNHLDIESKEVLESALKNYEGTIIFVSHDRYFINKIANRVFEMNRDEITHYLGNYDYYVKKKQEMIAIEALENPELNHQTKQAAESDRKQDFLKDKSQQREERRKRRKIAKIEEEIETLENEIETLEEKMTIPEVYEDHEKSLELSTTVEKQKQKVEQLMEEWALLHD